MTTQRLAKIICLSFLILLLVGCWDKKEIEKNAFVVAVGMDKGTDNSLTITYLIANPNYATQQQGGGDSVPREVITFQANDLISAKSLANTVVAKDISYDLLRYFIISENLAKDKDFIKWMYDATKDREIRRDSFLIVVKEKASKFILNNSPKLETAPHKYFEQIISRGRDIGFIPRAELHTFLRVTEADADLFLAAFATTIHEEENSDSATKGDLFLAGELPSKGETNNTQFLGSAIFKEGTMIGKLNGEETRLYYLLSNIVTAPSIVTTISDPFQSKVKNAIRIKKYKKNDFKMERTEQGKWKINLIVPLNIEVLTDFGMENYAKNVQKREGLKKHLEEQLTIKFDKFIKKTQEEFKGQPFGWSLNARKHFLTIPEYKKIKWMKTYPNMEINIAVIVEFGEFGRQSKLPKLKEVRD